MANPRFRRTGKGLFLTANALLAKSRITVEAIRSSIAATGDPNITLSQKQIRLDIENAEKLLLDADVAHTIELPLVDGGVFTWHIARPQGLLRKYSAASPALRRILAGKPSSVDRPWGLVHYHDEISPGDILRPIVSRQHTVFRFSFKEFSKHLLSNTRMWFTYAVLRTMVSANVVGGLSRCFRDLMRVFFPDEREFPQSQCGNRHR